MQKYLLKFSSRIECMEYLDYLKSLGRDRILFYYLTIDTGNIPIFVSETEEDCIVEVNAAFQGDPPEGFLDRVELFTGFDPGDM